MIYLMDDTIRANVVFGVPENEIDDDKVWEALRKADYSLRNHYLPRSFIHVHLKNTSRTCSN